MAHQWGYTVFKMDGLWTGTATRLMYVNNGYKDDEIGESRLHDPDKTQIEAFRDGLKLVRKTAGPDVFLLGCCVSQNMRSFGGAFGLLDAMRIGPDTGAGRIGAPHGSRNYFLHGRVWQNDPDCVSVRAATPLDQARLNATWTAIAGQLFYNSDWLPDLPPERLEILKRTMPAHGLPARPVDLFENEPARIWLLSDTRGGTAARRGGAVQLGSATCGADHACATERLGLPPARQYVAFDFWANRFVPPFAEAVAADLPPASCRVLAVRPAAEHPQLLSTSRHVTQGIVDVLEEQWDSAHAPRHKPPGWRRSLRAADHRAGGRALVAGGESCRRGRRCRGGREDRVPAGRPQAAGAAHQSGRPRRALARGLRAGAGGSRPHRRRPPS